MFQQSFTTFPCNSVLQTGRVKWVVLMYRSLDAGSHDLCGSELVVSHDRQRLTSGSIFRPLMIVTQKITALAFQLHDGESRSLQLLTERTNKNKIAER